MTCSVFWNFQFRRIICRSDRYGDWSDLSVIFTFSLALTLMDTWKNYKVPAATELLWMIPHDEDFPQKVSHLARSLIARLTWTTENPVSSFHFFKLLPLPDGISVDPSDDFLLMDGDRRVDASSPREEYSFELVSRFPVAATINGHRLVNNWSFTFIPRQGKSPNVINCSFLEATMSCASRDAQLRDQHYLCAGCGRHVEKAYARLYRYCEYTGRETLSPSECRADR